LEADHIPADQIVACPIPAGGITIHHCRTFHYTGPNLTDQPRRAYILSFAVPSKLRTTKRIFPWQLFKRTASEERHRVADQGKRELGLRPDPDLTVIFSSVDSRSALC
jgi:ectoine hydroxylase-related dioxygenase (phytanoyl-CoA dioxygenase family)